MNANVNANASANAKAKAGAKASASAGNKKSITVSALNQRIKNLLLCDESLTGILVEGELTNVKKHPATGHIYFGLKDEKSCIKAVCFNTYARKIRIPLENGRKVVVFGDLRVFERDGIYQLYAGNITLSAEKNEKSPFEKIKEELQKKGMLDPGHKKTLPRYPQTIGVVCGQDSAAFSDISNITKNRYPLAKLLVRNCLVQGAKASQEIASAVTELDESGCCDVIIVARGGGSAEDLACFNDIGVANAVFACKTPIVSAVGHETDFTAVDLVSDLRCETPSAAANSVCPDVCEIENKLQILRNRVIRETQQKLERSALLLDSLSLKPCFTDVHFKARQYSGELETLKVKLGSQIMQKISLRKQFTEKYEALVPREMKSKLERSALVLDNLSMKPCFTDPYFKIRLCLAESEAMKIKLDTQITQKILIRKQYAEKYEALVLQGMKSKWSTLCVELDKNITRLEALNPLSVLTRGYSAVMKEKTVIMKTKQVKIGDEISIRLSDGKLLAKVEKIIDAD